MVEDRPIMSVKYCLPVSSTFGQNYNAPCSAVSLRELASCLIDLLMDFTIFLHYVHIFTTLHGMQT